MSITAQDSPAHGFVAAGEQFFQNGPPISHLLPIPKPSREIAVSVALKNLFDRYFCRMHLMKHRDTPHRSHPDQTQARIARRALRPRLYGGSGAQQSALRLGVR
jgi:hypothetical protein